MSERGKQKMYQYELFDFLLLTHTLSLEVFVQNCNRQRAKDSTIVVAGNRWHIVDTHLGNCVCTCARSKSAVQIMCREAQQFQLKENLLINLFPLFSSFFFFQFRFICLFLFNICKSFFLFLIFIFHFFKKPFFEKQFFFLSNFSMW